MLYICFFVLFVVVSLQIKCLVVSDALESFFFICLIGLRCGSHLAFRHKDKNALKHSMCVAEDICRKCVRFGSDFSGNRNDKHDFLSVQLCYVCVWLLSLFFFSSLLHSGSLVAFHLSASVSKCQRDKFMGAEL